jgi:hypothetical protein
VVRFSACLCSEPGRRHGLTQPVLSGRGPRVQAVEAEAQTAAPAGFVIPAGNYEVSSSTRTYAVRRGGVDQVRFTRSLSGEASVVAESKANRKAPGWPGCDFLGDWVQQDFSRSFVHYAGREDMKLIYHGQSATLHVDLHFSDLLPVSKLSGAVQAAERHLDGLGLDSLFPSRVARLDATVDLIFSSPHYGRHVFAAFSGMPTRGTRVVSPHKLSTLYLHKSSATRSQREGRIYDKGRQMRETGKWTGDKVPDWMFLRLEAEGHWKGSERPLVGKVDSRMLRDLFLDRFADVGTGRLARKGAVMPELIQLLRDGRISPQTYDTLYAFLQHERLGMARFVYDTRQYRDRVRKCRELGVDLPATAASEEDLDLELDVRSMVEEIALVL